jgi:hypothetical protein
VTAKSMQRAERSASSLVKGPEILRFLKASRPELVAAAKLSRPPVGAVSKTLLEKFGPEIKRLPVKQFVGLAVRAILEDAGFEVAYAGVRISADPIFTTGSVYRLRSEDGQEPPTHDDALERMIKALRSDQAERALRALLRHFPNLIDEIQKNTGKPQPTKRIKLKQRP